MDITPAGAAAFTPSRRLQAAMSTDFLSGASAQGDYSGSTISAGTFVSNPSGGLVTKNHPGVWNIVSSTTAFSGYSMTNSVTSLLLGGGEVFDIVFRTPAVFTTVTARMGFLNVVTGSAQTNAAYLSFATSGAIIGNTVKASVASVTATIATLAISTWYHGRITVNAAGTSFLFEVYSDTGTSLGSASITTNLPTATGNETGAGMLAFSSGTVAITVLSVDYMSVDFGVAPVRGALSGF